MTRRVLSAAICALSPLCFVQQVDTATAQGEAIFERAMAAARDDAYPRYASYVVTVSFRKGTHHIVDAWSTTENIAHATVYSEVFSAQERESPYQPHGINLQIGGIVVNPPHPNDPIGPVALAIDQRFGLLPPHPYAVVHDADSFEALADGVTVIGHAGDDTTRYAVRLLDDSDTMTDHLALTPLRDPYHNRLRELWLDATTAHVQEAIVAGVGDRAPLDRVPWDVTFGRTDGGTYVADEEAMDPLDFGRDGRLTDAHITFDHLALSSRFPLASTFAIGTPVRTLHDP